MLTFSREVECIWRMKPNVLTAVYVAIRYGTLFSASFVFFNPTIVTVRATLQT